jgi:two-component system, OmpR family, response regulator
MPDTGTCFPRPARHCRKDRAVTRDQGIGPADGPPLRILCVDDNRDVADSSVDLLQVMGFEARACYSGMSALDLVGKFLPGVCLIDLNMPGMDGDELAARLREWAAGMPLVLVAVTAMNNEECCQRIRDAGFDLHLTKPVDPHDLISVVNALWTAWTRNK